MDGLRQRTAASGITIVDASSNGPKTVGGGGGNVLGGSESDASSRSSASGHSDDEDGLDTFTPPSFTVKDLLGAIPAHCFERSAIRSGAYILMDFAILAVFVYAATFINGAFGVDGSVVKGEVAGRAARYFAWAVYAFAAGLPGTGLWVIAHECGHQSFSESKTINNTVGWFLHSILLVLYHSWRISHGKHHAATGHMTRDQVFVPKTRTQRGVPSAADIARAQGHARVEAGKSTFEKADDLFEDAPLWVLGNLAIQQLFGWPAYLIMNASGQRFAKRTNHFEPESPIFDPRHRTQILMSDLGLALTFAALFVWGSQRGALEVLRYYVAPYLWVNSHLVMITFLQHTDPSLPHYRDGEWNFQRGALCTIDRSYFGFFMHGISETHVLHHVCSKIPHYNAWEASDALKAVLGSHYMRSEEHPAVSLYKNYRDCRFVEDDGEVIFYKNSQGKAMRKVVYDTPVSDSGVDVTAT